MKFVLGRDKSKDTLCKKEKNYNHFSIQFSLMIMNKLIFILGQTGGIIWSILGGEIIDKRDKGSHTVLITIIYLNLTVLSHVWKNRRIGQRIFINMLFQTNILLFSLWSLNKFYQIYTNAIASTDFQQTWKIVNYLSWS